MTVTRKHNDFERLQATPAVRKINRWRLLNSQDDHLPEENVTFARSHAPGFVRAIRAAFGKIVERSDSEVSC